MKIDFKCAVNTYNLPVAGGDRVIQNLQKQIDKLEERIRDIMEDESLSLEAKQQQKEQLELQLTAIRQQILARQRELQARRRRQSLTRPPRMFPGAARSRIGAEHAGDYQRGQRNVTNQRQG
jgi:hypothetical protein